MELVCDSDLCIVPITSATLDVKAIAAAMGRRGWSLFASADPAPRGSIEVCCGTQVILPPAPAVSNEGPSSRLLGPLPAVSWPWVPACGALEPPRRDGENAQKTGKHGGKMGEIRPKKCGRSAANQG